MYQKKNFLLFFACLIGYAHVHAETGAPLSTVSIEFQLITWKNKIANVYFESSSEGSQEIKGYSHIRSTIYKYEGPQTLIFYRKTLAPSGEISNQKVGEVAIDSNDKKLLFIFAETSEGAYKIIKLPDDSASFPYGSFQFFNLTKYPIAVQVQNEKFLINPKKQQLKRVSGNKDGSNIKVKIAMGTPEGWQKFYSNSWGHNDSRRTLVLIFKGENGNHIVKRFREQAPSPN